MVLRSNSTSAQCVYTSLADGNFYNSDGTTFNSELFSRSEMCNSGNNISNSTIIINHTITLNGNLSSTGSIDITAAGSLRQDGTRRILTIRDESNGGQTKLTLLATSTVQRSAPQLSVGILDVRGAAVNVGMNSTMRVFCTLFTGTQVTINVGNNALLNVLGDVDLFDATAQIDGPPSGSFAGLRVFGQLRGNSAAASNLFDPNDFLTTCVQGNSSACSTSSAPIYTIPASENNDPSCVSVLPVTLTRFVGRWTTGGTAVDLKWTTATEVDNDYFVIERSDDGVAFEGIAQVKGAGNSSVLRNYIFIDKSPLAVLTYYRLRQVDYDGKTTHSPIIALSPPQRSTEWLVATSSPRHFTILSQLDDNSRFVVLDMAGRLAFSQNVSAKNTDIVVPLLPTGVYLFQLITEQGRFTSRQIVTDSN